VCADFTLESMMKHHHVVQRDSKVPIHLPQGTRPAPSTVADRKFASIPKLDAKAWEDLERKREEH
jgi:hypothetical protein